MSKQIIFITICCYISSLQCADVLQSSHLSPFKDTSPPHLHIKRYGIFLDKQMDNSNPQSTNSNDCKKDTYFSKQLSPSTEAKIELERLKGKCRKIRPDHTFAPLDAAITAYNQELLEQTAELVHIAKKIPPFTKEIDPTNVTHACKLAIYVAEHINFQNIDPGLAPFEQPLSPAHMRSNYYLTSKEIPLPIFPYTVTDEHPHETNQRIWLANLLIALKHSESTTNALSHHILQIFLSTLPHEAEQKLSIDTLYNKILIIMDKLSQAQLDTYQVHLDAYLDRLYRDLLTTSFICKETRKETYINRELGYITLLIGHLGKSVTTDQKMYEEPLGKAFVAKYLGLYQGNPSMKQL